VLWHCWLRIWLGWWRWALVSPDGVAPSRMVGVSASVNLPLHYKVQKFSSGTSSPGWSRKKAVKRLWWCGIPSLSLNSLLGTLIFYLNITHPSDHSHLCSLKCHLIFFPDRPLHDCLYYSCTTSRCDKVIFAVFSYDSEFQTGRLLALKTLQMK